MRLFKGPDATPFTPILVDSGADYAMFDASIADQLGVQYQDGLETQTFGVGTEKPDDPNAQPVGVKCWVHEDFGLALKDANGNKAVISLRVAFTPNFMVAGLVGREYFFEAFRVTFEEAEHKLILELRDDAPNVLSWEDVPIFKPPLPARRQSRKPGRKR